MKAQTVEPELLRVGEVAARLRCQPETVRRMVRRRDLPAVRLGSSERAPIRISSADLQAWLDRSRPPAAGDGHGVSSLRGGLEEHEAFEKFEVPK